MNLCELESSDAKILIEYFKNNITGPILDVGCGVNASGVFIEIANMLDISIDGIDCLPPGNNTKHIRKYIQHDIYEYNPLDIYETITICDVTYIIECDSLKKVKLLLDRLSTKCEHLLLCIPYWVHEEGDTYMFRSSIDSPIKRLIRNPNSVNIIKYFPNLREIVHRDESPSSDGYGIYYYERCI